jgi:hypothetical protein
MLTSNFFPSFFQHLTVERPKDEGTNRLMVHKALKGLVRLELTAITTEQHIYGLLSQPHFLRDLAMKYVTLLPRAGAWESVLQTINENLSLESVELNGLMTFLKDSHGHFCNLKQQSGTVKSPRATTTRSIRILLLSSSHIDLRRFPHPVL